MLKKIIKVIYYAAADGPKTNSNNRQETTRSFI